MILYKLYKVLLGTSLFAIMCIAYSFYQRTIYCDTAFLLLGGVQFLFFLILGIIALAGRAMFFEEWRRM